MPVKWYTAVITALIDESPFVRRFILKLDEADAITFLPGQFITIDLPISDKRLKRWRSYSIANTSNGNNEIELCIVRKYDGEGTSFLFEKAVVGTQLTFKGPDGGFTLPAHFEEKNLVMICTGTGIAPFRSMLLHIRENHLPFRHIHLIFGVRHVSDLLYHEEFVQMAEQFPHFKYDAVLSRSEDWQGYKGYVHQVYMKDYALPLPDTIFMLCGWTQMIDLAVENLIINLGYQRNQILYELYG